MTLAPYGAIAGLVFQIIVMLALIVRVLLRPHRDPASRLAWIVVIVVLPFVGIAAYILFGEVNVGRRRVARIREVLDQMPAFPGAAAQDEANVVVNSSGRYARLFRVGQSISGFAPVAGNSAELLADSNAAIERMVEDIDRATEHVHLLFYIWLPDNNGCKIVEALKRAASRGVTCRAIADDHGSRTMIQSEHWRSMQQAGVKLAAALPIGNLLMRPLHGRIDLRNHRKIVVIDSTITYCGSQNCADPEFLVKAKYAPWVDIMARFEGPVAAQNQYLFAGDWMTCVDEDLDPLLGRPIRAPHPGIPAQVIGTGPTLRFSAMPELFESLIFEAHHKLVITTPYYVPNDSMQDAICAAAFRGVDTTMILPARNDSLVVAAASHSYYEGLLKAGVKIYEYPDGLLHAKTLTVDGSVTLIGSANMDRRSFELNYENNILVCDRDFTRSVEDRQQSYLAVSEAVTSDMVADWPVPLRLWNNAVAVLGPLL